MWVASVVKDSIPIYPKDFGQDTAEALAAGINAKYAGKVIPDVGLVITLLDILWVGQHCLYPGNGYTLTPARFRLVVFRPRVGEILLAKVATSNTWGIRLTTGFFQNILVPKAKLAVPADYETENDEVTWFWEYSAPTGEKHKLYLDPEVPVRVRVDAVTFNHTPPKDKDPSWFGMEIGGSFRASTAHQFSEGLGALDWWDK